MNVTKDSFYYHKLQLQQQIAIRENKLAMHVNELAQLKSHFNSNLAGALRKMGLSASLAYRLFMRLAGNKKDGPAIVRKFVKVISYFKAFRLSARAIKAVFRKIKTNSLNHDE